MGEGPAGRGGLAATFLHPGVAGAYAFGHAVEGLVRPYAVDDVLDLPVAAELAWGRITITAGM